ncbi:GNAT family N-acetyltransferase [Tengunoibacter tsumagoiensis]|uniref:N-acetyltransferase domain-containing protein n=1 Tax=Tengunoibacter tsumagoiensis TaxID=2014871 RepID=A0A401ZXJ4_9CHLR|nr:GNAT family N-acetyltransferase [Tengunoibacter tsumagoiensis]GCE11578.1 hypothetical protein KTT_14370 [Tengunoibacter tsumagoiensis]
MEIIIRQANVEDGAGIAAILHVLGWFAAINEQSIELTEQQIVSRIEQAQQERTHTILVAERRDWGLEHQIVGYVSAHWFPHLALGNDGYLSELFLLPGTTGQGIGSRLLDEITTVARQRHCNRLLLMNRRIRESYQRGFYLKRGWKELPDGAFFSLSLV